MRVLFLSLIVASLGAKTLTCNIKEDISFGDEPISSVQMLETKVSFGKKGVSVGRLHLKPFITTGEVQTYFDSKNLFYCDKGVCILTYDTGYTILKGCK